MSVTGEPESNGGQPQKVGVALTDIMTGLYASNGVLAALMEREQSGLGQHIDLSLFDVTVAALANQASNYLVSGTIPSRLGNAHPNIVPYQSFSVSDGHIVIAVGNDNQFKSLCAVLGVSELANDDCFKTNANRVKHRAPLVESIQVILEKETAQHWLAELEAHNVPAGPINTIDQVMDDPQVIARNMRVKLKHKDNSELEVVGNPLKFSRTPVEYELAPPELGQHTDDFIDGE